MGAQKRGRAVVAEHRHGQQVSGPVAGELEGVPRVPRSSITKVPVVAVLIARRRRLTTWVTFSRRDLALIRGIRSAMLFLMTSKHSSRRRIGRFLWQWGPVAVAVLVIVVVLAWQADVFERKIAGRSLADSRPVAEGVEIVTVESGAVATRRRFVGEVSARSPIEAAARVAGEIETVAVSAGDRVEAGHTLVRLDGEELAAAKRGAEASLSRAESALSGIETRLDRVRRGFEAEVATELALIELRQARDEAAAEIDRARAAVARADARLAYAEITSAFDAVVIDTFQDPGDTAMPGKPLLKLFEPNDLELVIDVPVSTVERFEIGDRFEAEIAPLRLRLEATVRSVVRQADSASRSVRVKLAIDPPRAALPGMFAAITPPGASRSAVLVPESSIGRVMQVRRVAVVDDERRVRPRVVRLGAPREDAVEVLAGLDAGERILRRWTDLATLESGGGGAAR